MELGKVRGVCLFGGSWIKRMYHSWALWRQNINDRLGADEENVGVTMNTLYGKSMLVKRRWEDCYMGHKNL